MINKSKIYLSIIALLLGVNIYLLLQKKENQKTIIATQDEPQTTVSEKTKIQNDYNAALARLDGLVGKNKELNDDLSKQNDELQNLKNRIKSILSKSNATEAELKEAKNLITQLNSKISGFESKIADLEQNNAQLSSQKDSLITENKQLNNQVEIGKRLKASNIHLDPIILRKGGDKASITDKAKKVDLLRVRFDIDENKLIQSGEKEFLIRIIYPDGTLLSNTALGSGSFIDAQGETQYFTLPTSVRLEAGIVRQGIQVDWRQTSNYEKGPYLVEIYHNGYLIGQGTTVLR